MTRSRPVVPIAFRNGLNLDSATEILGPLLADFQLVESAKPRLCVSGPYGDELPPAGATHIGYLCENVWPEPDRFDWCFGTWDEQVVQHPRYTRITWHGFDPRQLLKTPEQVRAWQARPRRFCNFLYAHRVAHRESFCRALARYQPVDCPGRSLNNQPPFDAGAPAEGKWLRKRAFLAGYRFTIAFENTSAPGYHTEKILDPMVAGSIPIYWGNPRIAAHFNPRSFVNVHDLLPPPSARLDRWLRHVGRRTQRDYLPSRYGRPAHRAVRRLHLLAQRTADWLVRSRGWAPVVELVRQLDTDAARYTRMLEEPWLPENRLPEADPMRDRWRALLTAAAGA